MSCENLENADIQNCENLELSKMHPLKINWETMQVSIGDITYGKLKGLIVANDKMEFTISIAETFKSE